MTDSKEVKTEESRLVPLLLLMTVVTGVVDAVSILRLGHIFVANMTGNVVFLAFGIFGAPGFSVSASIVALGAFLSGAFIGGRLSNKALGPMLTRCAGLEGLLVVTATVVSSVSSGTSVRYVMTVLLALAMGGQNATARRLAVTDLTTTVLTLTLTGIAADRGDVSHPRSHLVRRTAAVGAMLVGALVGAVLVIDASTSWALGAASTCLVAVAILSFRVSHS